MRRSAPAASERLPSAWSLEFRGERKQGDILRPLDHDGQPTLVARAGAGHAAGQDLAALLNERREDLGLFVIDEIGLIDAETADFLFANEAALAALGWAAGTSAGTTRAAGAGVTRAAVATLTAALVRRAA